MSEALIVAELSPDGASWRRVAAVKDIYETAGFKTRLLAVAEDDLAPQVAEAMIALDPDIGVVRPWAVQNATDWATRSLGVALVHADREVAPNRAVFIRDRLLAGGRDAAADLALVLDASAVERARMAGRDALDAPLLFSAAKAQARARQRAGGLVGLWVEAADQAVEAADAFLAQVAAAENAPHIALAGPGAERVAAPPVLGAASALPADLTEEVFYRGVDILVAPSPALGAPRLDLVEALRHGAAPLAVDGALLGLERSWRMPRFAGPEAIAAYLSERRGELDEGGLVVELRARADWTWRGLVAGAARQRERLIIKIRAMLAERAKAMGRP